MGMLVGGRLAPGLRLDTLAPDQVARVTADLDAALAEVRASELDASELEKLPLSALALWKDARLGHAGGQSRLSRAELASLHRQVEQLLPQDSQARAIWLSVKAAEAGAALSFFILDKDMAMDNDTTRDEMSYRLGLPPAWWVALVAAGSLKCPLGCGVTLMTDDFVHPLVCKMVGTGQRHTPVVSHYAGGLAEGLKPTGAHVDCQHTGYLEHGLIAIQPLPAPVHDQSRDAADIVILQVGWRPVLIDPTVVTPTVMAEAEKQKQLRARFAIPDPSPIVFEPFAVETFGRMGAMDQASLKAAARRAKPPRPGAEGKEVDVDGQMARYIGRLRALIGIGRALGCQAQLRKFRRACVTKGLLTMPGGIQLLSPVDVMDVDGAG